MEKEKGNEKEIEVMVDKSVLHRGHEGMRQENRVTFQFGLSDHVGCGVSGFWLPQNISI
mgnify:CR=1 FL=1